MLNKSFELEGIDLRFGIFGEIVSKYQLVPVTLWPCRV